MIDMPIGLPNFGYRNCDLKAREYLRPHQARVFLARADLLFSCQTQSEATAAAKAQGDKGVSAQLFAL